MKHLFFISALILVFGSCVNQKLTSSNNNEVYASSKDFILQTVDSENDKPIEVVVAQNNIDQTDQQGSNYNASVDLHSGFQTNTAVPFNCFHQPAYIYCNCGYTNTMQFGGNGSIYNSGFNGCNNYNYFGGYDPYYTYNNPYNYSGYNYGTGYTNHYNTSGYNWFGNRWLPQNNQVKNQGIKRVQGSMDNHVVGITQQDKPRADKSLKAQSIIPTPTTAPKSQIQAIDLQQKPASVDNNNTFTDANSTQPIQYTPVSKAIMPIQATPSNYSNTEPRVNNAPPSNGWNGGQPAQSYGAPTINKPTTVEPDNFPTFNNNTFNGQPATYQYNNGNNNIYTPAPAANPTFPDDKMRHSAPSSPAQNTYTPPAQNNYSPPAGSGGNQRGMNRPR